MFHVKAEAFLGLHLSKLGYTFGFPGDCRCHKCSNWIVHSLWLFFCFWTFISASRPPSCILAFNNAAYQRRLYCNGWILYKDGTSLFGDTM